MARVTVEDCVEVLPNRFELVLLAAQRARQLSAGSSMTVDKKNDKNPVIALREIAEETISPEDLKDNIIRSMQRASFKTGSDSELETEFLDAIAGSLNMNEDDDEDELSDDEISEEGEDMDADESEAFGEDTDGEEDIMSEKMVEADLQINLNVIDDAEEL